ncbi:MAG: 5'-3' exonuclease H3TH domain-containing protein [Leptospirales bacterium]
MQTRQEATELYCIDASIYIFRAYFSMPDSVRDDQGRPVNAVYGFTDFLIKLIQEVRPAYLAAFFDESLTSSFRNEIYPPYKTNRELPPADLERQLKLCRRVSQLMGAGDYAHDRYEADDLIGACMHRHRAKFTRQIVVSSDKDLAQLLGPGDILWDYARERRFDPAGITAHFGVPPEHIADLLALAGDAVDNIPGLPGIGQKTAAALIQKFGGLETILGRTADVAATKDLRGAARIAETLRDNAELARTCLKITRIATRLDAPGTSVPAWRDLKYRGPDRAGLKQFFEEEGFGGRLLARLEKL